MMDKPTCNTTFDILTNCILAFGIPTSRAAFFSDQHRADKDYSRRFCGVWHRYDRTVVHAVRRVEPYLVGWGVHVVYDLTLKQFGKLLTRKEVSVFILVSHWREYPEDENRWDEVEFADGLAPVAEVVEQVPRSFDGILDLCVCHPDSLKDRLRRERPQVVVKSVPGKATPYFWLYFYLTLFKQMQEQKVSYFKAFNDVMAELFRSI